MVFCFGIPSTSHYINRFLAVTNVAVIFLTLCILFHPPFIVLFFGNAILALLKNPAGPILDALVLALLGDDKEAYGRQRLWGSITCGVGSLVGGWLSDLTGNLESIIWLHVILLGAFVYAVMKMPLESARDVVGLRGAGSGHASHSASTEVEIGDEEEEEEQHYNPPPHTSSNPFEPSPSPPHSPTIPTSPILSLPMPSDPLPRTDSSTTLPLRPTRLNSSSPLKPITLPPSASTFYQDLTALLHSPALISFYATVLIMGVTISILDKYLWVYLSEKLGAGNSFLGFSRVFTVGLELPTFWFSKQIMRRIGVSNMLIAAQVILVVRLFGYGLLSVVQNPWFALPSESLHAVRFVDQHAPPSLKATAQGILAAIYVCLGDATGSLIGGWLSDLLGGDILPVFWWLGMINAGCLGVLGYLKWKERGDRSGGGEWVPDEGETERMMEAFEGEFGEEGRREGSLEGRV
ncbi:hypothetical protein HDV00_009454 [Rhizophlyctis rosea]|nr:hypothetical protein HDV00_009454 [Rhizophlyctis rosea]